MFLLFKRGLKERESDFKLRQNQFYCKYVVVF
jgi:hypothetical protein